MNAKTKQLIKSGINLMVKIASSTSVGGYFLEQATSRAMSRTQSVLHQCVELKFAAPNYINRFRVDTFSTKEPETLEWIDEIPPGSVFWDIGANIGLYTCYAAKARGCRVFAFEPSVFNLELLARNIFLNGFAEQATIVPLPLSEALSFSTLNMESMEWGAARSTFNQNSGQDGQTLNKIFEFQTIGLSMTDAVETLQIPLPD